MSTDQDNAYHRFGLDVVDHLRSVHRLDAWWEYPGYLSIYLTEDRDLRTGMEAWDYVGLYYDGDHPRAGEVDEAGEIEGSDLPSVVAYQLAELAKRFDVVTLREVLVHLNVDVPSTDTRSADDIADLFLTAAHNLVANPSFGGLGVACPMAEEV